MHNELPKMVLILLSMHEQGLFYKAITPVKYCGELFFK